MKSLILRRHEAERLAKHGEVLVVRVMNPQPSEPVPEAYLDAYDGGPEWCWWTLDNKVCNGLPSHICPFGRVGDVRWCKEDYYDRGDYAAIGRLHKDQYVYAADERKSGWLLHRAIHMARHASRFNVRVESVECRRLQSVTEDEAKRAGHEGVPYKDDHNVNHNGHRAEMARSLGDDAWRRDDWHWFGVMRRV